MLIWVDVLKRKNLYVEQGSCMVKERAWRVAGPSEWNKLPADIKQIRDTRAFRRALKTYLFRLFRI